MQFVAISILTSAYWLLTAVYRYCFSGKVSIGIGGTAPFLRGQARDVTLAGNAPWQGRTAVRPLEPACLQRLHRAILAHLQQDLVDLFVESEGL